VVIGVSCLAKKSCFITLVEKENQSWGSFRGPDVAEAHFSL
jgi:hypothetical protein